MVVLVVGMAVMVETVVAEIAIVIRMARRLLSPQRYNEARVVEDKLERHQMSMQSRKH